MQKKFNINDRLKKLPSKDAVLLRRLIAVMMGRSREHVSRLLNASVDSKKDFPSEVIIKLSYIFECRPEELYNQPPIPLNLEDLDCDNYKTKEK
jgi:hypothetical protein